MEQIIRKNPVTKLIFSLLLLVFLIVSCKKSETSYVSIFGNEVKVATKFRITESDSSYLMLHNLKSLSYYEPKNSLKDNAFDEIANTLLSDNAFDEIKKYGFHIQCNVMENLGKQIIITTKNTPSFSIFTLEENNIKHYFFEKDNDQKYLNIQDLNQEIDNFYSDAMLLLHFSSVQEFPLPSSSSIVFFNKNVSAGIKDLPETKTAKMQNPINDAIAIDLNRNFGFLALDNGPFGNTFCPFPCLSNSTYTTCRQDRDYNYECIRQIDCGDRNILRLSEENGWGIEINSDRLRGFRDSYMKSNPFARKYIGYYRLFSKYAKYDLKSINTYMEIMPDFYNIIELLSNKNNDNEIIITEEFYERAINVLNVHEDISNPFFQTMLEDIKNDLKLTKNLTKDQMSKVTMDLLESQTINN